VSEQTEYQRAPRRAVDLEGVEARYPLAPLQEGMLFHSVAEPRPGVDFQQFVFTAAPGFDVEAFRHAWQRVIDRHAILRTSFHWKDVREPEQRVHRTAEMPTEELDWSMEAPESVGDRIERLMLDDRRRGFDVTRAPCMRLTLARLPDERTWVMWSFHHLLLDGRSFFTVLTDLFASYEALRDGREPVLATVAPFGRYLEWLRDVDHDAAAAFWREQLEGAEPNPMPVALSRPRPLEEGVSPSGRRTERLSRETTERLRAVAKDSGVTLNTLLQLAWAVLLHRYGRSSGDVVFGATRAGRHGTVEGAETMVGMTINTLPVRARMDDEEPVAEVARRLRETWVAMRPHEHSPLTRVMEAASLRADEPLFDSIIVAENYDWKGELRSRVGEWLEPEFEIVEWTNYAITVVADLGPELIVQLEWDRRRFAQGTPERMLGHLVNLLSSMAEGLDRPVSSLVMLDEAERHEVLVANNATACDWDRSACIHHPIEAQVDRTPDAQAVSSGTSSLTFAELDARANRVATALRLRGVGPDVAVGICLRRGLDLATGLLGVLKAGGAYVPLDPDYPAERLTFMLEESSVELVLTEGFLVDRLPEGDHELLCMDDEGWLEGASDQRPGDVGIRPDGAACIFYTSGSTGKPKGAVSTHGSVVNHAEHMIGVLELGPDDRVPQSASMSFDLAVLELYATWMAGATVVMRPKGVLSSSRLGPWLERERITVLHIPTALWHQWVHDLDEVGGSLPPKLRVTLVGGEKASTEAVNAWKRMADGGVRWINIYGPTECTVNATVYEPDLDPDRPDIAGEIPIGKPISNVRVYLLDPSGEPVPVGVPGEVFIAGVGVSRGYLNSAELTAQKFLPDPFVGEGARMYRTGDLARWLPDGNVEVVGRVDHQVKIRGFRVELDEVETALEKHPALREVVVTAPADSTGTRRLVAYVIATEDPGPTSSELRAFLKGVLPEFMIPSAFVTLDELPYSPNGKVDRKRLPAPDDTAMVPSADYAPPRHPVEETLTRIFERVLGRERVGIHDSFFDLGGHSLLALRIIDEVGRAGLSMTVEQLFAHPTVAELAEQAAFRGVHDEGWSCLVSLRRGRERPVLYLTHTTPGDVLGYTDLVRELGEDQPAFGLQSLGLYDPAHAHQTIAAMAACLTPLASRR